MHLIGTIRDTSGKEINGATISLVDSTKTLIAYSLSNNEGAFTINLERRDLNKLQLHVTFVGYKKIITDFRPGQFIYSFVLQTERRELQPVVIKGERSKLKVNGDTLTYDVSAFSKPQDRVIEDVIKRMPGVTVDNKGKISYNGKNIKNFYLDGDNLLDDKYATGTKNIPNLAVDKVQILDNNQPIKALQGKAYTEEVDINITFRDSAKLKAIKRMSLGAGLPGNFDLMLNAMLFKKKYKSINYIKTNNTGASLSDELTSFNISDLQKNLDIVPPERLLSVSNTSNPILPLYRYLFNKTSLLNLNNIITLKSDVKLKANIYYLQDQQRQNYQSQTRIYLPNDTIQYSEKLDTHTNPNLLHIGINANINKTKYYLNNTFSIDLNKENTFADLSTNGTPLKQHLANSGQNFANEFNYIGSLGKETFEAYSYVNYITGPQLLSLTPGINNNYFNNGADYLGLNQYNKIPSLFTNTHIIFRFSSPKFQQAYKFGYNTTNQQLQSILNKEINKEVTETIDSASNHLQWQRNKALFEANYSLLTGRFILSLNLPIAYQHIDYSDTYYGIDKQKNNLLFTPSLSSKLLSGAENYFMFSYTNQKDIGKFTDIYRGFILRNYRSLYSNDAPLYESSTNAFVAGYYYRKAINLLFANIDFSISKKHINTLSNSFITNNLERRMVISLPNQTRSLIVSGSFSKYLFNFRTTLSNRISWQLSQFNQVTNGNLLHYNNYSTFINAAIDTKISDHLSVRYNADFTYLKTLQEEVVGVLQTVTQLKQEAEINCIILKNFNFKLIGEHYFNQQKIAKTSNYFFADAMLQYRLVRYKIDLEAGLWNIANVKTFQETSLLSNSTAISTYDIRPQMAVLKVMFNF